MEHAEDVLEKAQEEKGPRARYSDVRELLEAIEDAAGRGDRFAVADMIKTALDFWGVDETVVCERAGLARSTMLNYYNVADAFPPECRVRGVPFTRYVKLLRLDEDARRRILCEWAKDAESQAGRDGEEVRPAVAKKVPVTKVQKALMDLLRRLDYVAIKRYSNSPMEADMFLAERIKTALHPFLKDEAFDVVYVVEKP